MGESRSSFFGCHIIASMSCFVLLAAGMSPAQVTPMTQPSTTPARPWASGWSTTIFTTRPTRFPAGVWLT